MQATDNLDLFAEERVLSWRKIVWRLLRLRLLRKRWGVLGAFLGEYHPDKTTCRKQRTWWHIVGLHLRKIKARGEGRQILPHAPDRAPPFATWATEAEPEGEEPPATAGGASSSDSPRTTFYHLSPPCTTYSPVNVQVHVNINNQVHVNINDAGAADERGTGSSPGKGCGRGKGQGGGRDNRRRGGRQ